MVNKTDQALIVYGSKFEGAFEPTGYMMDRDEKTGEWLYPTPDNRPLTWSETSNFKREKYVLGPGKSLTFEASLSQVEVGKHFRRVAYIAFEDGETPIEIKGEDFLLK